MSWWRCALSVLALGASGAERSPESAARTGSESTELAVQLGRVTFLLPEAVIGARITAQQLSGYIKQLVARAESAAREVPPQARQPALLVVTVAVKPSGDHRIWVEALAPATFAPGQLSSLRTGLAAVATPTPSGLIIFQLFLKMWRAETAEPTPPVTAPKEWQSTATEVAQASGLSKMSVEAVVEKAWDSQPSAEADGSAPR